MRETGKVRIGPIAFDVQFETEDRETEERLLKTLFENATERMEALMADAVQRELEKMLPGIKVSCVGVWDEYPEEEP